jgi:hypothetical protein
MPDFGVVELVVGLSVGGELDEIVVNPLPPLHFVCLFEVDDAVLALVLSC